jgi:hypothetical protein
MRGEEERKKRKEEREKRPTLSTDRLFFNPLTETRHVTCRCGAAANQRRPRARLAHALAVARHLRPRLHILAPALAAQWDNPEKPYQ